MTTKGGIVQVGGSGLSAYNPVIDLERQAVEVVYVGVETSPSCCYPGGVEALLKLNGKSSTAVTPSSSTTTTSATSTAATATDDSDPFSFLEEDETPSEPLTMDNASKKGFKGFLKKVATTSAKVVENKMHSLAIRADQGRNRDLIAIGVYSNGTLISMTDWQRVSETPESLRFGIPLRIPTSSLPVVQLKLWMRSGAALLASTKVAKNYCLATCQGQLDPIGLGSSFRTVQLESQLLAGAALRLGSFASIQHAPLCGRGWSLADPAKQAYTTSLYHPPLHARYTWALLDRWLVAGERTTESSVVLPLAATWTKLAAQAGKQSLSDAETILGQLQARTNLAVGEYCQVEVNVVNLKVDPTRLRGVQPYLAVSWQRPDSVLEEELLSPTRLGLLETDQPISCRFYPSACRTPLPSVLQSLGGVLPAEPGFLLGNMQLTIILTGLVAAANPFDPVSQTTTTAPSEQDVQWASTVNLEQLLAQQQRRQQQEQQQAATPLTLEYPVVDAAGHAMGKICLQATLTMQQGTNVPTAPTAPSQGLVSLVGLPALGDTNPALDVHFVVDAENHRRHAQLATTGVDCSAKYLDWHISEQREPDVEDLQARAVAYQGAVEQASAQSMPPHEDRRPRSFRPSSSRSEKLLSAIPFNVHTATLSLEAWDPSEASEAHGSVYYNTTCGAPADHARGFGNVFKETPVSSPLGGVSGGLRRLEMKRKELGDLVTAQQNGMLQAISSYFGRERQFGRSSMYVPARHGELQGLKTQLRESVQAMHYVTWQCAMRRASVFSHALGIAATAFLSSLSDAAKNQGRWPELWARHGYLVSFEGLLSAAGKELGMIEDASVAIAMLRMVQVVLVRDGNSLPASATRSTVPGSPYLKWVDLTTTGQYHSRQFTLYFGVVPSYYDKRAPEPLRGNIPVRLSSLLFEVGVDIRQWGAHAGANAMAHWDQRNKDSSVHSATSSESDKVDTAPTGLLDEEDAEAGVQDDDVLVQLNYEAFQLLNAYAHAVSPANSAQTAAAQRTHPLLEKLHQHIVSSAGKMDHNILDEAASLAQQLGGGSAIFCKSGKDRTAMHITFKQAQFAHRYRQLYSPDGPVSDTTMVDAALMRVHGTRLPVCEKNVGDTKYAFNALQVKFMPDALKPPASTLAGFLKGGKVFTGGGIES